MHRSEIINHLVRRRGYVRYLEIGTALNETFPYISAHSRVGVDPDPRTSATFHLTSDDFFSKVAPYSAPFDIVFIDGSHERSQVLRDVQNSMRFLNPFGSIVMHDCNPQTFQESSLMYLGTAWEAVVELRAKFWQRGMDWKLKVVDTDCGCGVMTRGNADQMPLLPEKLTFDMFDKNRNELLGLISVDDFLQNY